MAYVPAGERMDTIDKSAEIVRRLRAESEVVVKVDPRKKQDKFRLATLYGSGIRKVRQVKVKLKPIEAADARNFEITQKTGGLTQEQAFENAIMKLQSNQLLFEKGVLGLEKQFPAGTIALFELIQVIEETYLVHLTRIEAAALVKTWNCTVKKVSKVYVDFNKFLKRLFLLAEESRISFANRKKGEAEILSKREQKRLEDSKLQLVLNAEDYSFGVGLMQLKTVLHKLCKVARKFHHLEQTGFFMMVNARIDGAINANNIRDFCLFNMNLRISNEEALAIVYKLDPMSCNNIPMSTWLKELKLLGMGVSSLLSPLVIEVDETIHDPHKDGHRIRHGNHGNHSNHNSPPQQRKVAASDASINTTSSIRCLNSEILEEILHETDKKSGGEVSPIGSKVTKKKIEKEVVIPIPTGIIPTRVKAPLPASVMGRSGNYPDRERLDEVITKLVVTKKQQRRQERNQKANNSKGNKKGGHGNQGVGIIDTKAHARGRNNVSIDMDDEVDDSDHDDMDTPPRENELSTLDQMQEQMLKKIRQQEQEAYRHYQEGGDVSPSSDTGFFSNLKIDDDELSTSESKTKGQIRIQGTNSLQGGGGDARQGHDSIGAFSKKSNNNKSVRRRAPHLSPIRTSVSMENSASPNEYSNANSPSNASTKTYNSLSSKTTAANASFGNSYTFHTSSKTLAPLSQDKLNDLLRKDLTHKTKFSHDNFRKESKKIMISKDELLNAVKKLDQVSQMRHNVSLQHQSRIKVPQHNREAKAEEENSAMLDGKEKLLLASRTLDTGNEAEDAKPTQEQEDKLAKIKSAKEAQIAAYKAKVMKKSSLHAKF
jgi:hypothetical protein